jgi:hypothetical protein
MKTTQLFAIWMKGALHCELPLLQKLEDKTLQIVSDLPPSRNVLEYPITFHFHVVVSITNNKYWKATLHANAKR